MAAYMENQVEFQQQYGQQSCCEYRKAISMQQEDVLKWLDYGDVKRFGCQ